MSLCTPRTLARPLRSLISATYPRNIEIQPMHLFDLFGEYTFAWAERARYWLKR
jgi:hypothetical protein